jgi:glutamate--cysteine ligase
MINDFEKIISEAFENEASEYLRSGNIGIEKESLRIIETNISQNLHPTSIGSSLFNKYITTDFSEAQLEFVTPPTKNSQSSVQTLDDIQHFVSNKIEDEYLWPFSIPPNFKNDLDVKIAKYGSSDLARFKELYRLGLAHRYGRAMQAISGVHFNFSFPEAIWKSSLFYNQSKSLKTIRSNNYLSILRNVFRLNWLILYLFGSSPIILKNYLRESDNAYPKIDDDTYYLPFATSLRMSDLGYQNLGRQNMIASTNSLDNYISDLRQATNTISKDFHAISEKFSPNIVQINGNIIQIEDEYYAVARPKSMSQKHRRLSTNLNVSGIDYIELRSLDINPFLREGISSKDITFLEVLFIYSLFKKDTPISSEEQKDISYNDFLVSRKGRSPDLFILDNGNRVSFKDKAKIVLDDMMIIAEYLDQDNNGYIQSIERMLTRIEDPSKTLSALLLDKSLSDSNGFIGLGNTIGQENRKYYRSLDSSDNINWELLEKESKDSISQMNKAIPSTNESFQLFLNNYFDE